MKCEKSKILERYLDDALKPAERKAFEEHLKTCEACRNALSALSAVDNAGRMDFFKMPDEQYFKQMRREIGQKIGDVKGRLTVKRRDSIWKRFRSAPPVYRILSVAATTAVLFIVIRIGVAHRETIRLEPEAVVYEQVLRSAGEEPAAQEDAIRPVDDETEEADMSTDSRGKKGSTAPVDMHKEKAGKETPLIAPQPPAAGRGIHREQEDDVLDIEAKEEAQPVRGITGVQEKEKGAVREARSNQDIHDRVDVASRDGKGGSDEGQRVKAAEGSDRRDRAGAARGRIQPAAETQTVKTAGSTDKRDVKRPTYFQFTANRAEKTDDIEARIILWEAYVSQETDTVDIRKGMLQLSELYMVRALGDTSRSEMEKAVNYYKNTREKFDPDFSDKRLDAMVQELIERLIERQ